MICLYLGPCDQWHPGERRVQVGAGDPGEVLQGGVLRGRAGALVGPAGQGGVRACSLEDGVGGKDGSSQQSGIISIAQFSLRGCVSHASRVPLIHTTYMDMI